MTWTDDLSKAMAENKAERDALRSTLSNILGFHGDDWRIEMWPEEYEGSVASLHVTCLCDGGKGACWCCDPINLTAEHVATLRRLADDLD